MTFTLPLKIKLALMAVLATCLVATAPAGAIVSPVNCGKITVKNKKWRIKADQIRCSTAKRYATRYLRNWSKPRYYKCRRGSSGSSVYRICTANRYDPPRSFLILKR